jgi:hypothetical protein
MLKYRSSRFDPHCIPEPSADMPAEGGMGIYFMRLVMNEVNYDFRDGYAYLTLVKRKAG